MTVIKSIKTRWQAFLNGTSSSMLAEVVLDRLPLGPGAMNRPDPYGQLSVIGRRLSPAVPRSCVRVYELPDPHHEMPAPEPLARPYEAEISDWTRQALAEMDEVVGVVIRDEITEVRTPQYIRRHRRNLAETLEDLDLLWKSLDQQDAAETSDLVSARMRARARRASDTEITGLIPVVQDGADLQEAWA